MATVNNIPDSKIRQAARIMDEIDEDSDEEIWRLFINQLPKRIYTQAEIENFADENLKPNGSPSLLLLNDIKRRNMSFDTFINCLRNIGCVKALNLFSQTSE